MNPIQSIQLKGQPATAIGNADLLKHRKTGLLCSRKCPADKILEAYERFKEWAADPGTTVISGFHSPVEKECLRLLLKGQANIILCPAREIEHLRLSKDWKPALDQGRMLILSPFTEKRADVRTIDRRNQLVADLADDLFIPYASPGGRIAEIGKRKGTPQLRGTVK
jgi:predicted Rossmann fold nucleotide-binding protein DprA/Smf involved in DNA uptake